MVNNSRVSLILLLLVPSVLFIGTYSLPSKLITYSMIFKLKRSPDTSVLLYPMTNVTE